MFVDSQRELYDALIRKDPSFDGVVFYAIKTTGIFCRPACTARKPKFENCEFFQTAQEALLAGYRPCKRCRPLCPPNELAGWAQTLIDAVEAEPQRRWTDKDFQLLGIDATTVRRQFKRRFGMTFVAYARARRMGLALKEIRAGKSVIQAQVGQGYESGSGFRDAFARILGAAPNKFDNDILVTRWIDTPIGPMLAVATDKHLLLLEFTDRRGLEREIERLRLRTELPIIPGNNRILESIANELAAYFSGQAFEFRTPVHFNGTTFQKLVWTELRRITVGEVRSYAQQAIAIGAPNSVRAVARANGANQLAIIVPCHRVLGANGSLTGYAGGLARKAWLLRHEKSCQRRDPRMDTGSLVGP